MAFFHLEIATFVVKNRRIRRQTACFIPNPRNHHILRQKSPGSSSNGVFRSQIATFVVKNRRSRRQTASFIPNPRNRHIRRQKSPDSSSNGVFRSQPSKSPHSSSKLAGFVVKRRLSFPTLEITTFVVKNRPVRHQTFRSRIRHIRRQKSPESSSNSVFHSQPSKSIRTLRLRNFLFSQCCGIQGWVGVISKL